jgi:Helix-turn-helix domain of transposase family ISL3
VRLIDAPSAGRAVQVRWRKRSWRCTDPSCPQGAFTEQNPAVAAPRAQLTARAISWAVDQLRRENASITGLARQLGVAWRTVWWAVEPVLEQRAGAEARFDGPPLRSGRPASVCEVFGQVGLDAPAHVDGLGHAGEGDEGGGVQVLRVSPGTRVRVISGTSC